MCTHSCTCMHMPHTSGQDVWVGSSPLLYKSWVSDSVAGTFTHWDILLAWIMFLIQWVNLFLLIAEIITIYIYWVITDRCLSVFSVFFIVSWTTLLFHSFSHPYSKLFSYSKLDIISSSHLLFYFSQHIILSWHPYLGMAAFSLCRIFVCIIWAAGLVVLNCFSLIFSQLIYISPSILKNFARYSCLGQQFTFKAEVYI